MNTISSQQYALLSILADLLVALSSELEGNAEDTLNTNVDFQLSYYARMVERNETITYRSAQNRLDAWRDMGLTISWGK